MSTDFVVPPHGPRTLFLVLLDKEWPTLKQDLLDHVWPSYEKFCRPLRGRLFPETVTEKSQMPVISPATGILTNRGNDPSRAGVGTAPPSIDTWTELRACRNCAELHNSLSSW